jgi:hypothetical protein
MIENIRLLALVFRFSAAMFAKLRASERKHGWNGGWRTSLTKEANCRALREHLEKGDPRDVAIFASFAWYHGWSTSTSNSQHRYH